MDSSLFAGSHKGENRVEEIPSRVLAESVEADQHARRHGQGLYAGHIPYVSDDELGYKVDGEQKEVFVTAMSVRQDFFNRSLSLILSGRDIFSSAKYEFSNSGPNFLSYGYYYPESPTWTLTLSYRINNYQRRPQRDESINIDFQGGM